MALFKNDEYPLAEALSRLTYCNPFLPERIDLEKQALGEKFIGVSNVWSRQADPESENPNIELIGRKADALAKLCLTRLEAGRAASDKDLELYETLVFYRMFHQFRSEFDKYISSSAQNQANIRMTCYRDYSRDWHFFLPSSIPSLTPHKSKSHIFSCLFLVRRAFHHIYNFIIGESMPAANLRAALWNSIFTHDLKRFWRTLYDRMVDMSCLISGPSGTGKELAARAVALSRYVPFDEKSETFKDDSLLSFHPLNLSELSPTLIESELFGHRKGSFTGALEERLGWLEICPALGSVFLDEIGDVEASIQVKLLRVLQSRTFHRLGEVSARQFKGKIIAATNRDLFREMREGRFREDLYYRICSDQVVTPSLHEQIQDSPEALYNLILFVCQGLLAEEEAESLAQESYAWVIENLGEGYEWPGNFRELEQCVRNILIRKEYRPPSVAPTRPAQALADALEKGELTADELLSRYCGLVYSRTGNYQETARLLQLDHRTVKKYIQTP